MIGFGFTSSAPSLLQNIPGQGHTFSSLCRRSRIFFPSRSVSVSTLHTALCANSELPRKRGRPKGSKNKAKSGKTHGQMTVPNSPVKATKPTKVADEQLVAERKQGHAEIEKQSLNLGTPRPLDFDQSTTSEGHKANGKTQPVQISGEKRRTNTSSHRGVEKTHAPLPPRKRGRPPKLNVHSALSNEQAGLLESEGTESHNSPRTEYRSGLSWKPKDSGHDDVTNTIRSSVEDMADEPSEVSNEPKRSRPKPRRGRPRAITNELEQLIIAESLASRKGESPSTPTKKRGRGRPRGSKNKPKQTPFDSRIGFEKLYEDASAAAEGEGQPDLLDLFEMFNKSRAQDFPNIPRQDWKEEKLRAPNGLPGSGPDDFIFELMPLVAKMEAEQNRVVSEKEKNVRRFVDKAFHQFASSHRSDRRQLNLKPFKLREDEKKVCVKCEGSGKIKCDYCEGFGYVDFGENAERFYKEFGTDNMSLLKHIMGNMYHCPYCDGSTQEECDKCSGSGSLEGQFPRKSGASSTPVNNYAKEEFDLEDFLEDEKDRIDVGLDGTIILRARRRRRSKNVESPKIRTEKPDVAQNEKQSAPQGRVSTSPGYPSQNISPAMSRLRDFLQKKGSAPQLKNKYVGVNSKATDFVHTTDYKVGRNLSQRKPIQFSSTHENKVKGKDNNRDKLQKKRELLREEDSTES